MSLVYEPALGGEQREYMNLQTLSYCFIIIYFTMSHGAIITSAGSLRNVFDHLLTVMVPPALRSSGSGAE